MTRDARIHGSAVSVDGVGILIIGAPGSGKSSTALGLIAKGAALVADDAVDLTRSGEKIILQCPEPIKSMIEVRGIGLLKVNTCDTTALDYLVDMDQTEVERLPGLKTKNILGLEIPIICGKANANLCNALFCLLTGGQVIPV